MGDGIGAVVLAAGMSRRMGRPKLLLPWGKQSILSHILATLTEGGVGPIVVVLGGFLDQTLPIASEYPTTVVVNSDYADGEMISSIKLGLSKATELEASRVFIVLGDQPMLSREVLEKLQEVSATNQKEIIFPSYHMKRGHPWLLRKKYWDEVIHLPDTQTLRDFLNKHQDDIGYINVDDANILNDIDTWEDYLKYKPG
jgi:molybdenum cofactor cytidylyltransferase